MTVLDKHWVSELQATNKIKLNCFKCSCFPCHFFLKYLVLVVGVIELTLSCTLSIYVVF